MPLQSNAKTTKTVYAVSAVTIKTFKKKNSVLTVTTSDRFFKGSNETSKKKLRVKVSKNCTWRYIDKGVRFLESKNTRKTTYKEIKNHVDGVKGLIENGYFTLKVVVKNKKVVQVDFIVL